MIYFDLDGVLRNLCSTVNINPTQYDCKIGDQGFVEYFTDNKFLLEMADPTEYLDIAVIYNKYIESITILTDQPKDWEVSAYVWISRHFEKVPNIIIAKNKLYQLTNGDILVEDNPNLLDYSQVWLIDRPYNRVVRKPLKRIHNQRELLFNLMRKNNGY